MKFSDTHSARLMTAAVGLLVLGAALYTGGLPWFALVLAVTLAGLWEFYAMFAVLSPARRLFGLAAGGLMVFLAWRFGPPAGFGVLLAAFWVGEAWHLIRPEESDGPLSQGQGDTCRGTHRFLLTAGLLYVPGSLLFALSLPAAGVIAALAAVMATDTGAYYAGHLLGGPKVWPRVSPKKTWAGSLGGLGAALAVCLGLGLWLGGPGLGAWLLLGFCLSLSSQMGDFIESGFKRACAVKDSGVLLPGHGGVLDRIDGLIPALLVYALARTLAEFP